jgi:hypothetical protein
MIPLTHTIILTIVKRKLAAKLICEIVYQNEQTQMKLCEICDFSPFGSGAVIFNTEIPKKIVSQGKFGVLLDQLKDHRFVKQLSGEKSS